MINPQLTNYIRSARNAGISDARITSDLIKVGWDGTDIEHAFDAVNDIHPITASGLRTTRGSPKKNVVVGLITLVLFIASGFVLYQYWYVPQQEINLAADSIHQGTGVSRKSTGISKEIGISVVSPLSGTIVIAGSNIGIKVIPRGSFEPTSVTMELDDWSTTLEQEPFESHVRINTDTEGPVTLFVTAVDDTNRIFSKEVQLTVLQADYKGSRTYAISPIIRATALFATNTYSFTLSPNDRWLVYFNDISYSGSENRHPLYGNIRILDLVNDEEYGTEIVPDAFSTYTMTSDCWTSDSSHCVIPSPSATVALYAPEIFITLNDTGEVFFADQGMLRPHGKKVASDSSEQESYESLTARDTTCSDCEGQSTDRTIMSSYVSSDVLQDDNEIMESVIMSKDHTTIYYGRVTDPKSLSVVAYSIAQEGERTIADITIEENSCGKIQHLRLSPDQSFLALQVQNGCDGEESTLYVIDMADNTISPIADHVRYPMHWNSSSDRLYFYKCLDEGTCIEDGGLYSIDTSR